MDVRILDIDDEDLEFQIAFVDRPAIESDAMAFSATKSFKFQSFNESKRIVMGYFMIADLAIERYSEAEGQYFVKFPKESITKIVENWSKNNMNKNLNEMHKTGNLTEGTFVLSHWQVDSELGIGVPKGFKQEADGSWFGMVKCYNDEVYNKFLDGTYNGFSVESKKFIQRNEGIDELLKRLSSQK